MTSNKQVVLRLRSRSRGRGHQRKRPGGGVRNADPILNSWQLVRALMSQVIR